MSLVRFLLRYVARYWRWATIAALATITFAAATVALFFLVERIFSEVLQLQRVDMPAAVSSLGATADPAEPERVADPSPRADAEALARRGGNLLTRLLKPGYAALRAAFGVAGGDAIWFVPVLFVAVFLVRSGADFVNGYAFQRLGLGATTDLRNDLYRRTLEQSTRFHTDHPSGELVSRVVHDIGVVQSAIGTRLVDLVQQPVTLLGLLWLLFSINAQLTVFCLVGAPAIVYPIVRFSRSLRKTSHRSQERTADLANLVSESARGHRIVKAFGMEGFEDQRFREATRRHLKVNLRAQLLSNLSSPVIETLGVVGASILLAFAGRAIQANVMEPSVLLQFLLTLYATYDPVRRLNKANLVVQQSLAAGQRIQALLELPVDVRDRPQARGIRGFESEIRYESVVFRYDQKEVLRGVDLEMRHGEVVALVGPSGGGKTTLVNLLPRFFDPSDGRIVIDGHDIRDLEIASLRALIGLVTQETVLFNDSIRANIAYGRADLPLDAVVEASRAAFALDFIERMPLGFDTVVGEGGVRLSGGQRQRLAIARALLKDAPILILDEATSQLDSESEALVQKALANLVRGRTTIVIAHRLATVRRADRIFVVEDGRIVEQGRHEDLLAQGGMYQRLHQLQFRD